MKSKLIKIGNSWGIRINSHIIKECELGNEIVIKVADKKLIVEAVKEKRKGWESSFKKMQQASEDNLLISEGNDFDKDWEW
ncbi:MAG: AbrB/MazE/SpoVT family DNA-binding domain-containing protein [Actinomycetia bacterium]|nr:AbrB/MazE/SpoVT family DNA-binding domain-containing protein [Actinomycetes bacterium]